MTTTLIECPSCRDHVKSDGPSGICESCGSALDGSVPMALADIGGSGPTMAPPPRGPTELARMEPETFGVRGLAFGAAGAIVGILVWAGLAYTMHIEIGYLAWAIGGLVGGACAWAGGRGHAVAGTCAAMALVAIFCGKLLGMQFLLGEAGEHLRPMLTQEIYEDTRASAMAFAALSDPPSPDELRAFLIEQGYTAAQQSSEVTQEELDAFSAEWAPNLRQLNERQPSFEQWQDEAVSGLSASEFAMEAVLDDLSAIDLLFAVLGVTTAFGLVMSASRRDGLVA